LDGQLRSANTPGIGFNTRININVANHDDDVEFASLVAEATRNFDPIEIARLKSLAERQSCAITVLPPSQRIEP
jgi:hypothetical protein